MSGAWEVHPECCRRLLNWGPGFRGPVVRSPACRAGAAKTGTHRTQPSSQPPPGATLEPPETGEDERREEEEEKNHDPGNRGKIESAEGACGRGRMPAPTALAS